MKYLKKKKILKKYIKLYYSYKNINNSNKKLQI